MKSKVILISLEMIFRFSMGFFGRKIEIQFFCHLFQPAKQFNHLQMWPKLRDVLHKRKSSFLISWNKMHHSWSLSQKIWQSKIITLKLQDILAKNIYTIRIYLSDVYLCFYANKSYIIFPSFGWKLFFCSWNCRECLMGQMGIFAFQGSRDRSIIPKLTAKEQNRFENKIKTDKTRWENQEKKWLIWVLVQSSWKNNLLSANNKKLLESELRLL